MDIVYASICNEILFRGVACPPQTLDIPSKPGHERARSERMSRRHVQTTTKSLRGGLGAFQRRNEGLITQGIYADTCGALVR